MHFLIEDHTHGLPVVEYSPDAKRDAARVLNNRRGERDGQVSLVSLRRAECEDFTVRGPADGRPLLIDVWRGLPHLTVESGKVVIHADSAWGNAVTVKGDAHVTVITTTARKVSATVEDAGTLVVEAEAGSHGYLHTSSPDATITVTGSGHLFTVRTPEGVTRAGLAA